METVIVLHSMVEANQRPKKAILLVYEDFERRGESYEVLSYWCVQIHNGRAELY
tara:strand:- start:1588 stop:1749 length:162 start_codon:yes stop_codon:yes gene_type:complete